MKLSQLKSKIAAYTNRSVESFVINGVDNLLEAINDARRTAQLKYDFNALSARGFLTIPVTGVDWSVNTTTSAGGVTPLLLKRVNSFWFYESIGGQIMKSSRVYFENRVSDSLGFSGVRLVSQGTFVRPVNTDTALTVMVEGIQWLDDLTDNATYDFFLDKGITWLTYQALQNLNLYLKEDSRAQLADGVVRRAWEDFVAWDGTLGLTEDAITLD